MVSFLPGDCFPGTMDYFILKGFLMLFLMQHCTSDDLPTSIQSSMAPPEELFTHPQEAERPAAEVVAMVAQPNLEDVHQAVQEASDKVEGGGAAEVLKELLERVVEAALGQVEGKQNEPGEDVQEPDEGDKTDPELSDQVLVGMYDVEQEERGTVEGDKETIADIVDERPAARESTGDGDVDESVDAEVGQKVVEETSKETQTDLAFVMLEGKLQTETTQVGQQVEVGVVEPGPIPGSDQLLRADTEQVETVWATEESLGDQVDEVESEVITLLSDSDHMEATQSAVEDSVVVEENNPVNESNNEHMGKEAVDDIEFAGGETDLKGGEVEEHTVMESEWEPWVNGGDDQHIAVDDTTSRTTNHSQREDSEPEDGAEASIEQDQQKPAANLSLGEAGEESDHGNEILTPTDDVLAHGSNVARPTLGYFVGNHLVIHPQARGEDSDSVDGMKEPQEMGLESWKISAIIAAVFLLLETAIIAIYVLKCRNKDSGLTRQRSCEEASVEPEATTAGDCSDDTLPAANGDSQQMSAPDQCDVATTLAQNPEGPQGPHMINMSNLHISTEDSANTGPGPESLLRTSML
ncbi:uncharacterized protein si:dkeyp-118a3.2 isoform X2 [Nerophis ophidion]|uniref:uncharacterized protein si:dkeyp-118a3.2 isoform X2 n=1 Tax=Nerophis ophidion TaxID=159077 RepID=UPI002AE09115|nr:uncharacterized protein si:dkeyp-118a3.2 isoform X2 [Nerophis ophidion]